MGTRIVMIAVISSLLSCQQGESVSVETQKERESYSIGYSMGRNINQGLAQWGDDIDIDALLAGIRAVLENDSSPAMSGEEIQEAIAQMKVRKQAEGDSLRAAANADGTAYLANYATEEGVVSLESGIHYKVLKTGDGARPKLTDTVIAHYAGRLIDGTEFDSSYKRKNPSEFPLNRVIKGWQEVLQLMPVGSKWEVAIPSRLGYGSQDIGNIPPNSALIFEIELLGIK